VDGRQKNGGDVELSEVRPETVQVWYTYCHLVDAGTVDESLGWVAEELAARGARLDYFYSVPGQDFYPHFTHDLDGLFRFGGCIPAIHAKAEVRDTVLLGLQWFPEGGGLLVRRGEGLDSVADLAGRRIGVSRSLNPRKVDYRRVTDARGIEVVLGLHGTSPEDVQTVDCLRADDWYDQEQQRMSPAGLADFWRQYGIEPDLRHRPLLPELKAGVIDACFVTDPFRLGYADMPRYTLLGSLAGEPDPALQIGGAPYALTCTRTFADAHPELVTAYLTGLIRIGRRCNADPPAAARLLEETGFYPPAAATADTLATLDFVPGLSDDLLAALAIEKDFMLSHGYISRDVDVHDWAAPEFLAAAERELAGQV
jgi:ABC-type nitrate/sulfonate/bicarbonate transport system substrate-binding protein